MKYDNVKYTTFNRNGTHSKSDRIEIGDYQLEISSPDAVQITRGNQQIGHVGGWFRHGDILINTKEIFDGRGMLVKVFYKDQYSGGIYVHDEYGSDSLFCSVFTKWSLWFLGNIPSCNCQQAEYPKKIAYIKQLRNSLEPEHSSMNFGELSRIGQWEEMQFLKEHHKEHKDN